ncbi:MAG: signal peptidase I [Steroidobacteraceae bacterium]|jgi:signal peptidase I
MNIDYSAILTGVLAAAAIILLIDAWVLKPKRSATSGTNPLSDPPLVSYARSFFPMILIVLIVRTFVFEPFRIPSPSMMPGLVDGDFIFVDKFSYGLRLPLLHSKVVPIGEPQRGDVIVFRSPSNPSINLIKRLIGLPGDHVVVQRNRVLINGNLVPLRPDGTYSGGFGFSGAELAVESFVGSQHVIMFAANRWATDFDGVVPAGHYFFMGDNRNDSQDSRFQDVGFVPADNLVGHARRIWMNWRFSDWPNLHRIGMRIG